MLSPAAGQTTLPDFVHQEGRKIVHAIHVDRHRTGTFEREIARPDGVYTKRSRLIEKFDQGRSWKNSVVVRATSLSKRAVAFETRIRSGTKSSTCRRPRVVGCRIRGHLIRGETGTRAKAELAAHREGNNASRHLAAAASCAKRPTAA